MAMEHAQHAAEQFAAAGIAWEFVPLAPGRGSADWVAALAYGEADVVAIPLDEVPVVLPESLAVTAVSPRMDPAEYLVTGHGDRSNTSLFGLRENALVHAFEPLRRAQLLDFRPDVRFGGAPGSAEEVLEQLRAGTVDAAILCASELEEEAIRTAGLSIVKFNPREFVPPPGRGVPAYATAKEDAATRRILKAVHHSETAALSNIERGALRFLGPDHAEGLGVYAERDGMGNYHVWAALALDGLPLRRVRISSSTSFQLAERLVKELQSTA